MEYHHDVALSDNTLFLAHISKTSREESMELQKFAKESYKDSKSIWVLNFIALVYLPASLVISIFGSDLIIDTNPTSDPAKSHLEASGEFWWFPALTFPLLFLTAGGALAWDRWQRKRDMAKFTFNPATDG
ncbi:hypothetical protein EV426DRAFT_717168 [Tirmania nivea]|nr:hypothetical protein EV426DRAFT_717168 [Tirmania nivea]